MLKKNTKTLSKKPVLESRVAIDIGLHAIKFAYFKENLLCLEEFPLFQEPLDVLGLKRQELIENQKTVISREFLEA